jgi:hypothetical protein
MQKNLATIGSLARAGDNGDAWAIDAVSALRNELPRLHYALIEVKLEYILGRLAPEVGRDPPALHRWPRARSGTLEIPPLATLKSNVAALRFQLVLWQFAWRERKAGFDPNQPRVPRGQPDGGQWTDAGGGSGGSKPSAERAPLRIIIHPRSWYEDTGSNSEGALLGNPPTVDEQEPRTTQDLNKFAKQAAYWLARAALKEVANPAVGTFINLVEAAYWGYKVYPYVQSYLDPPKSLDELIRAASTPTKGYDIHHIVEKVSALKDGFSKQRIDAPENLVRIPTLKHWQITGWYMTPNENYGRLSPREYLRGKSWSERIRIGRQALIKYEVLKP